MADIGIKLTAQDNTKSAFDSVGRNLGNIQTAASSVAGALAGIGVGISVGGFVAMTKAIVDGLDAMNDLKDATGASIENISALEDVARRSGASFDTVSTALVKLNQGLNAAKPGSETENAIKAIGLSVKDLKALDPAEAFQKVAVALSGFADDADKARFTQELFGKSLKEVAPLLKDLAESGQLNSTVTTAQAEAAEKLNKQIFSLQKNALDLGRALTSTLIPALADGVERFILAQKHAGSLLDTLALYGRLDYSKNIQGNLGDVEKQISQLEERATRITSAGAMRGNDKMIADLKAQAAYLKELRQAKILAEQGDNSDAVSRRFTRDRPSINAPDLSAAKDASAAAAKALAEQNREIAAQNKLIAENAGLTGSFAEDWNRLTAIYTKGGFSLAQYTEAQAKLLANQPAIKANVDAEAKAMAAIDKANMAALESRLKYVASLGTGLDKLQQETASQQEYIDRLGLSKEAVAELDAAKLESQAVILDLIAIKELDKNLDEEQFELYKKQSAELRKQATLKMQGSLKEAQLDIEKEITAERKRGWEETDRIARDVFTSWATDGGNAAQKIGDTLKKALLSAIYEATLKPLVMQVYASVAGNGGGNVGSVLSAVGGGGSAGGMGGLSGLSSLYGYGKSALSTVGGWFGMGGAAAASGLAATAGGTAIGGAAGIGSGTVLGGGAATAGASSGMMASLASIPVVGWIAMGMMASADAYDKGFRADDSAAPDGTRFSVSDGGVLGTTASFADRMLQGLGLDGKTAGILSGSTFGKQVVYSLLGGYKISPAGGGISGTLGTDGASAQARTDYTQDHRGFLGIGSYTTKNSSFSALDGQMQAILDGGVKATTAAVQAYASAIGLSADAVKGFTQSINIDLTGLDADGIQKKLLETFSGFGDAMVASAYGSSLTALQKSGETSTQTLERLAGSLGTVNEALLLLGNTTLDISVIGASAADSLVTLMGGLDQFRTTTADYYKNFYSEEEQRANIVKKINEATVGSGLDAATATREQFRALVDAQDLTTESGRKTYAALMSVEGAFASITPSATAAATATKNLVDAAMAALKNAVSAEKASINAAYQVQADAINAQINTVGFSVDKLTTFADSLKGALSAMQIAGDAGGARAAAQAQISDALMAARSGAALPTDGRLDGALSAVAQPSEQLFGSFEEYARDFYKTANDIAGLNDLAQQQLTDAEQMQQTLKDQLFAAKKYNDEQVLQLDALLVNAQAQIDATNGVGASVLSLADALRAFQDATRPGASSSASRSPGPLRTQAEEDVLNQSLIDLQLLNKQSDASFEQIRDFVVATYDGSVGSLQAIYAAAQATRTTTADIAAALGTNAAYLLPYFRNAGIPEFAVGTNYIPYDGYQAILHEGEAVVPKAYNPAAGGSMDGGTTATEVALLRQDMRDSQAQLALLMQRLVRINEKWDGEGQPEVRTVTA